jgi:hypothetical protein
MMRWSSQRARFGIEHLTDAQVTFGVQKVDQIPVLHTKRPFHSEKITNSQIIPRAGFVKPHCRYSDGHAAGKPPAYREKKAADGIAADTGNGPVKIKRREQAPALRIIG